MSDLGFSFTWYGHSCLEVVSPGGATILFDPWFGNPRSTRSSDTVERCDLMLLSHGHFDHLGGNIAGLEQADAVRIAGRLRPTWPCIHELSLWLTHQLPAEAAQGVIGMNVGGTVEAAGLKVTMVPAIHSAGDWNEAGAAVLDFGEPVGFVVELENGRRFYYAGDTDVFGDMRLIGELHHPEIAFLPIGGHYTMGPRGAALAAELLGVKTVVPLHYGTFPILTGTPDELRAELAARHLAKVEVLAPEPGVETS